jgi:hypothetical protein
MEWDIAIDGRKIDLAAFGTSDKRKTDGSEEYLSRSWNIALENATGKHDILATYRLREDVFDGWDTYSAGTYTTTTTFTIVDTLP